MAGERRRRGGDGLRERPRERGNRRERAEPQRGAGRGWGRAAALAAALAVLALGLAAVEWDRWSAATRLVTPHPAPPALPSGSTGPLASPHLFWGTYRPHVYFGMKTRSPRSLVTGLMWLQQREGGGALRHTCEQSDGPARYGWRDARRGELRGRGRPDPPSSLSFSTWPRTSRAHCSRGLDNGTRLAAVTGTTEELGRFTLTFLPPTTESGEDPKYASYNYLEAPSPGLHRLTELVRGSLSNRFRRPGRLAGGTLSAALSRHAAAFESRFEETFGLARKGFPPAQRRFAQAALSDLLGGMGYFHGRSLVQGAAAGAPRARCRGRAFSPPSPPAPSSPAGSSGRGFPPAAAGALGAGAEPRGHRPLARPDERRGLDPAGADLGGGSAGQGAPRVPPAAQRDGQPPHAAAGAAGAAAHHPPALPAPPLPPPARLVRLGTNRTQAGPLPLTFRWRGRDPPARALPQPQNLGLGAGRLPPRLAPPRPRSGTWTCAAGWRWPPACWPRWPSAWASRPGFTAPPSGALSDNELLERLHWAPELGAFADYGNHSAAVGLRWQRGDASGTGEAPRRPRGWCGRCGKHRGRSSWGLWATSASSRCCCSCCGPTRRGCRRCWPRCATSGSSGRPSGCARCPVTAPSTSSATPSTTPRTGAVPSGSTSTTWHCGRCAVTLRPRGPQRERAAELYRELRHNLVANVYRQFSESGFLWEHYSDSTGRGQGCRPFAGWSTLVVLVMAEDY
ncbi:unnamed protein product [Bubo scandiacus]